MSNSDSLSESIPVFCTTAIPKQILNEFFIDSLGREELAGADWIAVLVNTMNTSDIKTPTRAPIDEPESWPFDGWDVERIIHFAEESFERFKHGIVSSELVILDEQTIEDRTCLLVTLKEGRAGSERGERLRVRSDFKSSIVLLNVKVVGCGGDGHFETVESDGIIRI